MKLNNTTTEGYDSLLNKAIKGGVNELLEPLMYIINLSFEKSVFPNQ